MTQPPMLILLSTPDPEGAGATLARAGHLALPAASLAAALEAEGPARLVAQRLAGQCDACVIEGAPPPGLAAVFRALRRPVYPSAHLVPRAEAPAPPPSPLRDTAVLGFVARMLDR
jgi:hypothetical protein